MSTVKTASVAFVPVPVNLDRVGDAVTSITLLNAAVAELVVPSTENWSPKASNLASSSATDAVPALSVIDCDPPSNAVTPFERVAA